ncbi:MAG: CDP-archaeol synthase [Rickettsiaceae bacterium]|nr:MAG: CDP-archaeol synthase [Rickettsiaceae bacterium]
MIWIPPLFVIFIFIIAAGMLIEWSDMTKSSSKDLIAGMLVIPTSIISLLTIYEHSETRWMLLLYFAIIWSVDSFAMLGGQRLKGPKLAPQISPNKTWSGLITGVTLGTISAIVVYDIMVKLAIVKPQLMISLFALILISMTIGVMAQLSDLFVSCFKRKFKIKDSGYIIPGHGGILDRFDSIILTTPILLLIKNYYG